MDKSQSDQQAELDMERQGRAREYARIQRALSFLELGATGGLLTLFLVAGWSSGLRDWAEGLGGPWPVTVALYAVALGAIFIVATLPIDFYSGYVVPKRYSLSTQSVAGWALDTAKGLLIGGVIALLGVEALYALVLMLPGWWWLALAALAWLFVLATTWLAPLLLMPIFFKLRPLEDTELVSRLVRLAERAGTRVGGVYVMDLSSRTTAANAMLAGLGNTRRIILGDTLLANYTHDEIETVLAHELAHHVHNDLQRGLAWQAVLLPAAMWAAALFLGWGAGALGLRGVQDPAALPLFAAALGIFGLLTMPAVNALSRWREREADLYALRTTRNPHAFRSVMLKLANQNLADAEPPGWVRFLFYSHPPIAERVRLAGAVEEG